MIQTRVADASDCDVCVALVSSLLVELGAPGLETDQVQSVFADVVGQPSVGFIMLAEADDAIVGVCSVSLVRALRTHGTYAVIQEMYIRPEARSRAVGAALLKAALDEAVNRGCRIVELGTPMGGVRQIKFYTDNGFREVGARLRWSASP